MDTIIESKNLSFKYLDRKEYSLKNINFNIKNGELIFIVGNSGSGKSTLLNIINGIISEVIEGDIEGELLIKSKSDMKIYEKNLILGNVFQNPRSQFFTTNTTAELVFEMENYGFSKEKMEKRLKNLVDEFGVKNLLDRDIFNLSSGERQFLALLTTIIINPEVVIFDEPSANLDYGNAMRLKKQITKLKNQGKTIIISDHRAFYLRDIIDRVFLIEDGKLKLFDSEKEFINYDYNNRVFNLFEYQFESRKILKTDIEGMVCEGISYKNILEKVSFSTNKGEISTLIGINGVGKSTLAKIISGILKPDFGKVKKSQKPLYIMQDADFQLFGSSCIKELEITQKEENLNIDALKLLNIFDLKDKHPQTLSGGEKQRLQMAIAYISTNDVIILDEPTSGLDQNSMNAVIDMLEKLKIGRTIILISHDYEFIRKCSDKIIYLKEGKVCDEFYLFDENIKKLNNIYIEMEKNYE